MNCLLPTIMISITNLMTGTMKRNNNDTLMSVCDLGIPLWHGKIVK